MGIGHRQIGTRYAQSDGSDFRCLSPRRLHGQACDRNREIGKALAARNDRFDHASRQWFGGIFA